MSEVSGQVKNLEDEVKLLKGEIKAILSEIRTAVLSRDNPFTMGASSLSEQAPAPAAQPEPAAPEPKTLELPAPIPGIPDLTMPRMPMNNPQPQPPGIPPVPPWAGAIPQQQPAPAPFAPPAMPGAPGPAPSGPQVIINAPGGPQGPPPAPQGGPGAPMGPPPTPAGAPPAPPTSADAAPAAMAESAVDESSGEDPEPEDSARGDTARKPIPIRPMQNEEDDDQEQPPKQERSSTWSLPALAALAVWAEDALNTLGPRRFNFVLDLATFAELLSSEGREVLSGLIDVDTLSDEEDRPINVNECLVVLRQLEAIVHGEKIVRLPRRRGVRHRRIR